MPKVSINIIKEWFTNQKKPPQEQFWAWLDSFWHKDEAIPQSAVENLSTALKLKADLVNGVVPEEQLPFSVVTSEVITLGSVELIDTKTYLRLHSSGANKVRVKGKLITRTFQNQWTITPVVADGVKVLRGYAVKNNDDFLLAEGSELPTYVEPEIPEDALEIFKITMRSSGNVIEQTETGLKYIAEDGWRNILLTEDLTVLPYNFDLKSSYWINTRVANPVIGGIHNGVIDRNASPTWDGKEFWLFNNTGGDLLLDPANVIAIDVFLFSDKLIPLTVKNNTAVLLKLKDNVIEIMQAGGGGASFPVIGNDGDVLELDNSLPEKVKWVAKLKGSVNKMLHYWDAGNWVNSGVEFISAGIIKVRSIVLTTSTGTALPNELGTDGTSVWFGVAKKKLAYQGEIFEHHVRGKRVELAGVGGTSLNIDLNAGNLFALTNTGVGNVPIAFTNMILADESAVFNLIVTGNLLTLPAGLIADSYNDIPNVTKKRKYIFTIEKGGISPIISYNLINI